MKKAPAGVAGAFTWEDQGEPHANTSRPTFHNATRSACPVVPPLIRRVIASNWPASASSLRPLRFQYQAADSAAASGCSSSSG